MPPPPGTPVCWRLVVKSNATVPTTGVTQVFHATVKVLGDGVTELDVRDVYFDGDPPQFYFTLFGYHDAAEIERALREAGFQRVRVEQVAKEVSAASARDFAIGLVRGNPVALTIAERGVDAERVVDALAAALARECGDAPMRCPTRALVVTAEG